MDKKSTFWQWTIIIFFVSISMVIFCLHYAIFHDLKNLAYYAIFNIASLFLEVIIVTFVIQRVLDYREKQSLLNKLNMEIGAFYSEAGTTLIKLFSSSDKGSSKIGEGLCMTNEWSDKDFIKVKSLVNNHDSKFEFKPGELAELKKFLAEKRDFLLRLLENPNLLEHEAFTNLLWAVFHLTEELVARKDLNTLSEKDLGHIVLDIKRAYKLLIIEWLQYMKHLKSYYPYLFSFAMRTNPFDCHAAVEIV